jgi:predicted lactoylglutathione lyase
MNTKIFVNLPVKDLSKSIAFFTRLGFKFDPQFTDDTATCMIVSGDIYVMLLTRARFKEFTPMPVSDASKATEVLVALLLESRQKVDEMVRNAIAAGATTYAEPKDYGFMYHRAYQDLDGHIWEVIFMEPGAMPQNGGKEPATQLTED